MDSNRRTESKAKVREAYSMHNTVFSPEKNQGIWGFVCYRTLTRCSYNIPSSHATFHSCTYIEFDLTCFIKLNLSISGSSMKIVIRQFRILLKSCLLASILIHNRADKPPSQSTVDIGVRSIAASLLRLRKSSCVHCAKELAW